MKRGSLIVFMKNPMLGQVKSRLAESIGDVKALEIYEGLLGKCRTECMKLDVDRYLYYHQFVDNNDAWEGLNFYKQLQREGELGEKMSAAFYDVNTYKGPHPCIIIGTDCYDLDASRIKLAFEALKMTDLVIGPANDGGYYLLGTNAYYPSLFEEIQWSTPSVMKETVSKATKLGLNYMLLEELIDLDTFDDLKKSGYPDISL